MWPRGIFELNRPGSLGQGREVENPSEILVAYPQLVSSRRCVAERLPLNDLWSIAESSSTGVRDPRGDCVMWRWAEGDRPNGRRFDRLVGRLPAGEAAPRGIHLQEC